MAEYGFVFFPNQCIKDRASCKIHVYLHGSSTEYEFLGLDMIKQSGFNDYAVTNDLIVLYPQTASHLVYNILGSWVKPVDNEIKYGKDNYQVKAIKGMVDRLTEKTLKSEFLSYNEYQEHYFSRNALIRPQWLQWVFDTYV